MAVRPPRVIVTKIGFDGHDRGSRVIAATLRDAGMEVIYTPPWQEISTVVKLATDHLIVPQLMAALKEAGLSDIQVIVGGIVPVKDEAKLLEAGVARVFHPGAALDDVVTDVITLTAKRRQLQGESA